MDECVGFADESRLAPLRHSAVSQGDDSDVSSETGGRGEVVRLVLDVLERSSVALSASEVISGVLRLRKNVKSGAVHGAIHRLKTAGRISAQGDPKSRTYRLSSEETTSRKERSANKRKPR